jgi:hypothetical protein
VESPPKPTITRGIIMENVRRLFAEAYNLPFPTGLSSLIKDLDIDLDTYADYVVGTASSVIKGVLIENGELKIDYELSRSSMRA